VHGDAVESRANAIRVPSGDHAGKRSFETLFVILATTFVETFTVAISSVEP